MNLSLCLHIWNALRRREAKSRLFPSDFCAVLFCFAFLNLKQAEKKSGTVLERSFVFFLFLFPSSAIVFSTEIHTRLKWRWFKFVKCSVCGLALCGGWNLLIWSSEEEKKTNNIERTERNSGLRRESMVDFILMIVQWLCWFKNTPSCLSIMMIVRFSSVSLYRSHLICGWTLTSCHAFVAMLSAPPIPR